MFFLIFPASLLDMFVRLVVYLVYVVYCFYLVYLVWRNVVP